MPGKMTSTDIEKIFRDEAGRALATPIRLVGDFDLAQDALQDAFAVALERCTPVPAAKINYPEDVVWWSIRSTGCR
jgi:predicted RNA polymerase sigma factor